MVSNIVSQELKIVRQALDRNPASMIIYGNRILSDLVFNENDIDDLVGVFIREMGVRVARCIHNNREDEAIGFAKDALDGFENVFKERDDAEKIKMYGMVYHRFHERTRELVLPEWEIQTYSAISSDDRVSYCSKRSNRLLELLRENRNVLWEQNDILGGITSESERISIEMGGTVETTLFVISIRHLNSYYYYTVVDSIINEKVKYDLLEDKFAPILDRFMTGFGTDVSSMDIVTISRALLEILSQWRRYYIIYGEVPSSQSSHPPNVMLPEDKIKVAKAFKDALQHQS
ncbi:MAG: hypothetical protein ACXQTJ_00870 [Candidatus Syntropharchaeales archaeon]